MEKCLIVAIADNNAIGRKNALLWNLPGDMKYFRQQTTGNAVIMGWMTFQSIGRPLPRRRNIVISLFPWPEAPAEVTVVDSLDAAFAAAAIPSEAKESPKAFVIGGAYTYAEAMEVVDTMYITHVHDTPEDADAFFPEIDPALWRVDSRSDLQTDPETGITYEFVVYKRN
ncbi:MAG: dihydrofolate reductase [Bacteroidales bacterium]|nr:dihydrofolate reductase [Bacteroidales bacterium]